MNAVFSYLRPVKALSLSLVLLLFAAPSRAQYTVSLTGIDYFSTSGEIPVAAAGGQAQVEFGFYSGGPTASVLRSTVLQAVEQADCGHIITDVAVQYTYGTYEGVLTYTLAVNNEGYREIAVTAASGSVTITQAVQGTAVYTLTKVSPSTNTIFHGQTVTFQLSDSDTFATYRLCRTEGMYMSCGYPEQGTGSPLSFTDTRAGTYTAHSDYPSPVAMNGSITVSYLPFYGYAHSFSTASYTLDVDGTMKTDGLRTLALTYNYLKLPRTVKKGTTSTVTYIYDADGNKLAVSQDGTAKNYYCGDFVYDGSLAVAYILTPNGQLTRNPTTGAYTTQYNIPDHLGNVRSVVSSSGTVLQSTDYYPFGLAFSDSNIASNRYLYNGKELEDYTLGTAYLGTLDYGARHYDPRIARWTVPDPMAEKYYGLNAYSYCAGNPVMMVDQLLKMDFLHFP